jgi:hypothetical protein
VRETQAEEHVDQRSNVRQNRTGHGDVLHASLLAGTVGSEARHALLSFCRYPNEDRQETLRYRLPRFPQV